MAAVDASEDEEDVSIRCLARRWKGGGATLACGGVWRGCGGWVERWWQFGPVCRAQARSGRTSAKPIYRREFHCLGMARHSALDLH